MGGDVSEANPTADEITVYSRPGCPYCTTLKMGLKRSRTPFRDVNIWNDPQAAAFVRSVANGNETVPTVTIGEVSLVNPSAGRVRSLAVEAGMVPAPTKRSWFGRKSSATH